MSAEKNHEFHQRAVEKNPEIYQGATEKKCEFQQMIEREFGQKSRKKKRKFRQRNVEKTQKDAEKMRISSKCCGKNANSGKVPQKRRKFPQNAAGKTPVSSKS